MLQIANSITTYYYYKKVIVGFTETYISVKVYHKELKWLLLS